MLASKLDREGGGGSENERRPNSKPPEIMYERQVDERGLGGAKGVGIGSADGESSACLLTAAVAESDSKYASDGNNVFFSA